MPEVEFTIDTATGEFQMHVQGVAKLVKDLAGKPGHEEATAEYHLRPRVHSRSDTHIRSKHG